MESMNASDVNYFLFSNSLISDHQLGFYPRLSTLDMLLLRSQQWLVPPNLKGSALSPWTYIGHDPNTAHKFFYARASAHLLAGQCGSNLPYRPTLSQQHQSPGGSPGASSRTNYRGALTGFHHGVGTPSTHYARPGTLASGLPWTPRLPN